MSPVLEVPAQLALAVLLATGQAPASALHSARIDAPGRATVRTADLDYTDDAWLALVQAHGEAAGIGPLATRVFRTSMGRIYVPVTEERQSILALKRDPAVVTSVATAVALAHAQRLKVVLARAPRPSELLLAHQVGVEVAASLLLTAAEEPRRPASEIAPEAALAYPAAFFEGRRSRTAGGVVQLYAEILERTVRGEGRLAGVVATATGNGPARGPSPNARRARSPWLTVVNAAPPLARNIETASTQPASRLQSFSATSSAARNWASPAP